MSAATAWVDQFARASDRSAKVACVDCGRVGYPGRRRPNPWQEKCLAGHPHRCACGRVFATLGAISAHQRPRRVSS